MKELLPTQLSHYLRMGNINRRTIIAASVQTAGNAINENSDLTQASYFFSPRRVEK